MADEGLLGHGTTISGASAGTIADVISIDVNGFSRDAVEVGTMDSVDKVKSVLAGMVTPGTISITASYVKATGSTLFTAYADAAEDWTITFPDSSTVIVEGFVTSCSISDPHDGNITESAEIQMTEIPVFTAAT